MGALALLSLTGCYEDFTPNIAVQPVLCLNSMITAGEPVIVKVSHTWAYTDGDYSMNSSVDDAVVSIFVDGALSVADYIPKEGDRICIVADSQTYGHAEAEVAVPYAVPIDSLRCICNVMEVWRQDNIPGWEMQSEILFNMKLEVNITDCSDVDNYFHLSDVTSFWPVDLDDDMEGGEYIPTQIFLTPGSLRYDLEPIFSEHIDAFEAIMGSDAYGFTFFTDRQFSGSTYTLNLHYNDCRYFVRSEQWNPKLFDCGYVVSLSTVSKSCYDWSNYLWYSFDGMMGEIGDVGFGDQMWGYSNVSTGAGVVAARAISTATISLNDFLESAVRSEEYMK